MVWRTKAAAERGLVDFPELLLRNYELLTKHEGRIGGDVGALSHHRIDH